MASNNNVAAPKEERRRRIAERGSDRMALITGRISALPPQPPSATSSPSYRSLPQPHHGKSLSAFDQHLDQVDDQTYHFRPHSLSSALNGEYQEDQTWGVDEDKQDSSLQFSRLKHQGGFKYSNFDTFEDDPKNELDEPLMKKSHKILKSPNNEGDVVVGGSKTKKPSKRVQILAPLDKNQLKRPARLKSAPFFSSRELNACIIASEMTRAISSLTIALVVVFFYMVSGWIVATRPLYILLLTDVTIVLGRLYHEKAKPMEEIEGVDEHGDHSWGDAVRLLERGLCVYQAIRGFFIDCSIYLVIVVCGASLM